MLWKFGGVALTKGSHRRALELQMKGATPSRLAPLLTTQANTAAALAALAAAGGPSAAHTLRSGNSIPAGLQAAATNAAAAAAAAATAEAAQAAGTTPAANAANARPSPAGKRSTKPVSYTHLTLPTKA